MGGTLRPNDPPTSKIGSWPMDYSYIYSNLYCEKKVFITTQSCKRIKTKKVNPESIPAGDFPPKKITSRMIDEYKKYTGAKQRSGKVHFPKNILAGGFPCQENYTTYRE